MLHQINLCFYYAYSLIISRVYYEVKQRTLFIQFSFFKGYLFLIYHFAKSACVNYWILSSMVNHSLALRHSNTALLIAFSLGGLQASLVSKTTNEKINSDYSY